MIQFPPSWTLAFKNRASRATAALSFFFYQWVPERDDEGYNIYSGLFKGLILKVITLILVLDMLPSSSEDNVAMRVEFIMFKRMMKTRDSSPRNRTGPF